MTGSLSGSDAANLNIRLRSNPFEETEKIDRSPQSSITPRRRNFLQEDDGGSTKSGRTPSFESNSWQAAFHNSKTDNRWWRKTLFLVTGGLLLLVIGFTIGRNTGTNGLPKSVSRGQAVYERYSGPISKDSLVQPGVFVGKTAQKGGENTGLLQESFADSLEGLDTDTDFIAYDLEESVSTSKNSNGHFNSMGQQTAKSSKGTTDTINANKIQTGKIDKAKSSKPKMSETSVTMGGSVGSLALTDSSRPVKFTSAKEAEELISSIIGAKHVRIYIADLPAKYNLDPMEAVFTLGTTKPKNAKEAANKLLENPFGDLIGTKTDMLYTSHPHNLDVLFYYTLMKSPLRTRKAEEADAVLVPFWLNKFIKLEQELEKPNRHDLAYNNFWVEASSLLPYLGIKPHLLIVPGQEEGLMSTCGGFGLDFLCHEKARLFTVLTPEMYVGKPGSGLSNQIAPGIINQGFQPSNTSIAIADFANIHFHKSVAESRLEEAKALSSMKIRIASESFRARAPLRKLLRAQCLKHAGQCVHMEPQVLHSINTGSFSYNVMQNDKTSWFSLQPPGDSAMRTSLYNSILAGAIPAVFDDQLAKVLPFSSLIAWDQLVIQIPPERITKAGKDIVELLEVIPTDERLQILGSLQSVKHLLQYSLSPATQLVRFDGLQKVTIYDDAFTMALKAAFQRLCQSSLAPHKCASKISSGQSRHLLVDT